MNSPNKRNEECNNSASNRLWFNVQSQTKVSMDFNPCLICLIYSCGLFPSFPSSSNSLWAAVDGNLKSEALNLIEPSGGGLRVTLWGLTADPWTACSASAICVIRTNTIRSLASFHRSIWSKRWKHNTFTQLSITDHPGLKSPDQLYDEHVLLFVSDLLGVSWILDLSFNHLMWSWVYV